MTTAHVLPRSDAAPPESCSTTMMDLLFSDFAAEHTASRRLFERVPDGQGDWRPHERSRTLAEIANRGVTILTTDEMDVATRQHPVLRTTAPDLLQLHDQSTSRLAAALAAADVATLSGDWTLRRGSQVLACAPRRVLLRTLVMSHLVHHRAQLGLYFRLLNIPIPGMYGPSADDVVVTNVV